MMMQENKNLILKIQTGAIVILLLLLSFFGYQWKRSADNYESINDYATALKDTLKHRANGVVEVADVHVSKEVFDKVIGEREDLKRELKLANIKIQRVGSISQVKQGIDISAAPITIPMQNDSGCPTFTQKPFSVDSAHYSIRGVIGKSFIRFDSINFPDSLTLITYFKRHLFSKDEYDFSARHSNPFVKTEGLMHLSIKVEKAWWDKRVCWIAAGVVGGYLIFHR